MIRGLGAHLQHLKRTPDLPGRLGEGPTQLELSDPLGTGRRGQNPVLKEQQGRSVHRAVGAKCIPGGLGPGRKLGGVEDDEVESLVGTRGLSQVERQILVHHFHLEKVSPCVLPGEPAGAFARLHSHDPGRTGPSGVAGKGSGVAVPIENPAPTGEPGHGLSVLPLVEVEAGLLSLQRIAGELEPVLVDDKRARWRRAPGHAGPGGDPLQALDIGQGHLHNAARARELLQEIEDLVLPNFHPHAKELHHEGVSEDIDHEPGQAVALAVHPPEAIGPRPGKAEDFPAQREGVGEPRPQEPGIDLLLGPGQKPHPDLGASGVKPPPDHPPLMVGDRDHIPRGRLSVGTSDRFGQDPGVAVPQRLGPPALQDHGDHGAEHTPLPGSLTPIRAPCYGGAVACPPGSQDRAAYLESGPAPRGELCWRFDPPGRRRKQRSSPAILGDTVYLGGAGGALYALELTTGVERWTCELDGPVHASPVVDGDMVFVGSTYRSRLGLNHLFALDAREGRVLWRAPLKERWWAIFWSSCATDAGVVYVGFDRALYALYALNGHLAWRYEVGGMVASSPVVVDGLVYFGSYDHHLYAVDVRAGALRWKFDAGAKVSSTTAVLEGSVFFGTLGRRFYCLDAQTGTVRWERKLGGPIDSSAAAAEGSVHVGSLDRKVYCLDAATGEERWVFETGGMVRSSPAVVDARVYIGSNDGRLHCLDAATGKRIWSYPTGGRIHGSPVVHRGVVIFSSLDGTFYALR
jgi:outer membrane protein assembly factor BamB